MKGGWILSQTLRSAWEWRRRYYRIMLYIYHYHIQYNFTNVTYQDSCVDCRGTGLLCSFTTNPIKGI